MNEIDWQVLQDEWEADVFQKKNILSLKEKADLYVWGII